MFHHEVETFLRNTGESRFGVWVDMTGYVWLTCRDGDEFFLFKRLGYNGTDRVRSELTKTFPDTL